MGNFFCKKKEIPSQFTFLLNNYINSLININDYDKFIINNKCVEIFEKKYNDNDNDNDNDNNKNIIFNKLSENNIILLNDDYLIINIKSYCKITNKIYNIYISKFGFVHYYRNYTVFDKNISYKQYELFKFLSNYILDNNKIYFLIELLNYTYNAF